MSRTRVAVLRGGPSEEYDISMLTGAAVLDAIDRDRHEPVDVIITKAGEWLTDGYVRYPEQILNAVDVVFVALHGAYGEDGTVQRILERHAVPYTGSNSYASRMAMHKAITKDHLKDLGIKLPPHMVVTSSSLSNLHAVSESISEMFGPEYVIKPIASGSSVGTSLVKNKHFLPQALRKAFENYDELLVEQRIAGKEATCGVIERFRDSELYVLPAIEIVPPSSTDFFDYTVKYDGSTQELCPGRFTIAEKKEIERASKLAHTTLGLSQYSRSDFMVTPEGVYFLEVNTLPGLTTESLFPKAINAVGGTYPQFVDHLLTDALTRGRRR